jgi:DNA-binding transcriptional LysR family regulator
LGDSSLRASRLFSHRLPVVSAPSLFERYGRPAHPDDLLKMPIMTYTHVREAQEWRFSHPVHGEHLVRVEGSIRMNNGMAANPMLLAGLAVAIQPEAYIWNELQDGRLEEVLTDWTLVPVPVHLLTPPGRARPARDAGPDGVPARAVRQAALGARRRDLTPRRPLGRFGQQ